MFTKEGPGGWLGISDHYWLTALILAQSETVKASFDATPQLDYTDFRADYVGACARSRRVKAFATASICSPGWRVDILQAYQTALAVPDLDKAVDWGNFFFLTRPYFWLLDHLGKWATNFGLGILMMTVIVRLAMFPLVNQSAAAMAKMRAAEDERAAGALRRRQTAPAARDRVQLYQR